jgi:hypothetical protein
VTLSLSSTNRVGALVLALACTAVTFGTLTAPAPAMAAASGPYYVAELAAPATDARTVASDVAWFCEGTICKAAKGTSRPAKLPASRRRAKLWLTTSWLPATASKLT